MAKLSGDLAKVQVRGRIGDLLVYPLYEDNIVRKKSGVSKGRYRKDPAFSGMRRNQGEFGLASKLGKRLRWSMMPFIRHWTYRETSSDLTGYILGCIRQGSGPEGKHEFELANFAPREDVFLRQERVLLSCGRPFRFDRQKAEVYLRMTYGKLKKLFGTEPLPLQIVLGLVAISEVHFEDTYCVVEPSWHGRSAFNTRKGLTKWPAAGELRLKVRLKMEGPVPGKVGLIGVLGIAAGR